MLVWSGLYPVQSLIYVEFGLNWVLSRFIKIIPMAYPLTELLKKGDFGWNTNTQNALEAFKKVMIEASVLQLPNFSI